MYVLLEFPIKIENIGSFIHMSKMVVFLKKIKKIEHCFHQIFPT